MASYPRRDRIGIVKHVACRDADHGDALSLQPAVTPLVVGSRHVVMRSVDFDAKTFGRAIEVKDVRPGRMLLAETQALPARTG